MNEQTAAGGQAAPVRQEIVGRSRRRALGGLAGDTVSALLSVLVCSAVTVAVWQAVAQAGIFPPFTLPTPLQVARAFGPEISSGDLATNLNTTLQEAFGGFLLGACIAGVLGYVVAHVRPLEFLVTPFVAAGQGVPAVAVAPIMLLLFRGTLLPRVLICAAVVLFPLLVTTITALRTLDRDLLDVARVFGASRLQRLIHVELPLASPVLLAGVKLGLTLSITGAVVAEFVASDAGLGFMVNTALNSFDATTRYVALVTLAALSMALYGIVSLFERMAHRWLDV